MCFFEYEAVRVYSNGSIFQCVGLTVFLPFHPAPVDFSIQVLSSGSWPFQQSCTFALPSEVRAAPSRVLLVPDGTQRAGRAGCPEAGLLRASPHGPRAGSRTRSLVGALPSPVAVATCLTVRVRFRVLLSCLNQCALRESRPPPPPPPPAVRVSRLCSERFVPYVWRCVYVEALTVTTDWGEIRIPHNAILLSSWNAVISDSQLFTLAVTVAEN